MTKTLAYFLTALVTKKKLKILTPWPNDIKLFWPNFMY